MKPGLRPMNLGEILDRTFVIYRRSFLAFAGTAALPAMVMLGVHLIDDRWLHVHDLMHTEWRPGAFVWNLVVAVGYYHISGFLEILIQPAQTAVASAELLDQEASIRDSLQSVAARWRAYLWIAFLKLIAVLVIPELLAFGLIVAYSLLLDLTGAAGPDGIPSLLVFFIPGFIGFMLFLWLGACFSLTIPVAALEGRNGIKAMRRSWVLTRRSRFRLAELWLSIFGISVAFSLAVTFSFRWIFLLAYRFGHFAMIGKNAYHVTNLLLGLIVASLVGALYPIAITLLYYDQRVRHEFFDLEQMMKSAGMIGEPVPPSDDGLVAASSIESMVVRPE